MAIKESVQSVTKKEFVQFLKLRKHKIKRIIKVRGDFAGQVQFVAEIQGHHCVFAMINQFYASDPDSGRLKRGSDYIIDLNIDAGKYIAMLTNAVYSMNMIQSLKAIETICNEEEHVPETAKLEIVSKFAKEGIRDYEMRRKRV